MILNIDFDLFPISFIIANLFTGGTYRNKPAQKNELPRRKQRGIKNFKFCHSALDAESSPVFWIPASAGMTNSPQAARNTTRRDSMDIEEGVTVDLDWRRT
jgi:hypothetical protein